MWALMRSIQERDPQEGCYGSRALLPPLKQFMQPAPCPSTWKRRQVGADDLQQNCCMSIRQYTLYMHSRSNYISMAKAVTCNLFLLRTEDKEPCQARETECHCMGSGGLCWEKMSGKVIQGSPFYTLQRCLLNNRKAIDFKILPLD